MFCSKCGKQIADDSVFCPGCGAKLQGNAPEEPKLPTTKEGWMLLAVKDAIAAGLKNPESAKFSSFEQIETDSFGRTYAEIIVYATNSYNAVVPTRYAIGFYDVTDSGPCQVIPKSLYMLPNMMVGAQRKVAKAMMKMGKPR